MKELLKTYVNSCYKIPEEQIALMSDDLLYSYYKRVFSYPREFWNYERKYLNKFINKDADEEEQYKLLCKGIEASYFNILHENAIINFIASSWKIEYLDDDYILMDIFHAINTGKLTMTKRLKYNLIARFSHKEVNKHSNTELHINPGEVISDELKNELFKNFWSRY